MNEIDKKLFEYLGDKTISFGCKICHWYTMNQDIKGKGQIGTVTENQGRWLLLLEGYTVEDFEIIGHEPTLTDFHRWMINNCKGFIQEIGNNNSGISPRNSRPFTYDSSKSLLEQSDTTKEAIIKLIEEYGNN